MKEKSCNGQQLSKLIGKDLFDASNYNEPSNKIELNVKF